jgi:hypothetical protein
MGTAIVARPAQTAIEKPPDVQRRLFVTKTLTGLAEARQAAVSEETLRLYSAHLAEFEPEDVKEVARSIARRKRAEGETAFPSLGDLIEPLAALRNKHRAEVRAHRERQEEIDQFWAWAAEWMKETGNDEAELLRRFPTYTGTKARD